MLTDFDQQQLKKMHELIMLFKKKTIILSLFVSKMESLYHSMEAVDKDFNEVLLEELPTLDAIAAVPPNHITESDLNKIIFESIENIEKSIKKYLNCA